MYPHRIRLRGPWDCEQLARLRQNADGSIEEVPGLLPPSRRMTLPCRWKEGGLADFCGRVRFQRRFGYPGRIDAHERVWLTFTGVEGVADVTLNGTALGKQTSRTFEYEVTALLAPRNSLEVIIEAPDGNGGLAGEVALEIRCTAYLRNVRAWHAATAIHVAGEVVGFAQRPLELYVRTARANVAYATIEATAEGRPFDLEFPRSADEEVETVGVELVHVAVVWYACEICVASVKE